MLSRYFGWKWLVLIGAPIYLFQGFLSPHLRDALSRLFLASEKSGRYLQPSWIRFNSHGQIKGTIDLFPWFPIVSSPKDTETIQCDLSTWDEFPKRSPNLDTAQPKAGLHISTKVLENQTETVYAGSISCGGWLCPKCMQLDPIGFGKFAVACKLNI